MDEISPAFLSVFSNHLCSPISARQDFGFANTILVFCSLIKDTLLRTRYLYRIQSATAGLGTCLSGSITLFCTKSLLPEYGEPLAKSISSLTVTAQSAQNYTSNFSEEHLQCKEEKGGCTMPQVAIHSRIVMLTEIPLWGSLR